MMDSLEGKFMRKLLIVLALTGASLQCQYGDFVPNPDYLAQNCPAYLADLKVNCAMPDLAPPQPKCAAAKGLTGDAIVCVDFDKLSGLSDQTVKDWNFTPGGGCPGWEIVGGKLQVKNFGAFVGASAFHDAADRSGSRRQPKVPKRDAGGGADARSEPCQAGCICLLGRPIAIAANLVHHGHKSQDCHQPSDCQGGTANGTSLYQPLFELTSALAGGATGWQIESIAVMGNP